ncbi:MAG: VOC family protein [Bacillota bacterium]
MIKGIAHTAYVVEDLEKSIDFYSNILGFDKLFTMRDDEENPVLVYLKVKENQFIELFPASGSKEERKDSEIGYAHLCLEVDDINEIAQKMEEEGITLDTPPKKGKDGNYQCWIKDPDGNPIEFMQMMPDSLQNKYQ